jgi:hypothetical protein
MKPYIEIVSPTFKGEWLVDILQEAKPAITSGHYLYPNDEKFLNFWSQVLKYKVFNLLKPGVRRLSFNRTYDKLST